MRIIFMGNPEFAVPSLEQVAKSKHQILYVISNPPKRIGRGRKLRETEVGIAAKAMGIPVLQPPKLNEINFLRYIASMHPDIFVVVAYKILPGNMLVIPKYGAINLHPSLLPKYRGPAPIQWALINGDKQTAVTTISLSEKIDSGSILMQESVVINDGDNFGSLAEKLSKEGAELVVKTLDRIESNQIDAKPQNEDEVTLAPKIKAEDLEINWNKTAIEINDHIRAFSPYPGAFTTLNGKRLKIFFASIVNNTKYSGDIGGIASFSKNQLLIQTGQGLIDIHEVQFEGKKRMEISSFLRGIQMMKNTILGAK